MRPWWDSIYLWTGIGAVVIGAVLAIVTIFVIIAILGRLQRRD